MWLHLAPQNDSGVGASNGLDPGVPRSTWHGHARKDDKYNQGAQCRLYSPVDLCFTWLQARGEYAKMRYFLTKADTVFNQPEGHKQLNKARLAVLALCVAIDIWCATGDAADHDTSDDSCQQYARVRD